MDLVRAVLVLFAGAAGVILLGLAIVCFCAGLLLLGRLVIG